MFGLISKKKLAKELKRLKKDNNMQGKKGVSSMPPIYLQGFEDGNDNVCNYIFNKYCK